MQSETRVRLPEPIVWEYDANGLHLMEALSPRELDVLRLMVDGLETKEIATVLGLRFRTVGTHISHILIKMNARNRTDAVRIALQAGLIRLAEPTSAQAAIALSAYYATLAQKLLQEGRP